MDPVEISVVAGAAVLIALVLWYFFGSTDDTDEPDGTDDTDEIGDTDDTDELGDTDDTDEIDGTDDNITK